MTCKAKQENNGVCPHHNLQCGWPQCNEPSQPYPENFINALKYDMARHDSEQAQQELVKPFAWANTDDLCADTAFRWCEIGDHKTTIYTFPPAQRKPLTDEEFISMVDSAGLVIDPSLAFEIKEMVEAAHGIKENT